MERQRHRRRTAMRSLVATAALLHVAAAIASPSFADASVASSSSAPVAQEAANTASPWISSKRPTAYHTAAASSSWLERIGHFLNSYLPDGGQWDGDNDDSSSSGSSGGGGLFGDGGASLAWDGSTLEVVKTQASYLTRPAAFGPRIHSDDGLHGLLLPVSDFYRQGKVQDKIEPAAYIDSNAPDNHGCPHKGGPGWREGDPHDDDDEDDGAQSGELHQEDETIQRPQAQQSFRVPDGKHAPSDRQNDTALPKVPKDWIALVERGGGCAFAAKVRVAQALGAIAVVVGDAPSPAYEHDEPNKPGDPGRAGRLVTMFAPGDTSDIKIPSTFITRPSYVDLIRLIDEETQDALKDCAKKRREGKACDSDEDDEIAHRKRGVEVVLWRDDVMWEWPLIDLAFILLLLPSFMTLVTIIVHRIRMVRQRRKDRAPELAVLNLPCLIWRPNGQPWEKFEEDEAPRLPTKKSPDPQGRSQADTAGNTSGIAGTATTRRPEDMELSAQEEGTADPGPSTASAPRAQVTPAPQEPSGRTYYSCDECAICLSDFVDGEKVRILPCGHVFHLPEIDSWLLRVRKLCPICKRDITVPIPPSVPTPALAALEPQQHAQQRGASSANATTITDDEALAEGVPADSETATETSPLLHHE